MTINLPASFQRDCTRQGICAGSTADQTSLTDAVLRSYRRDFSAGEIIKLEGDDALETYCVAHGWLAVSKSIADGQRQIIDFVLPGDILSPTSANQLSSAVMVEALTRARVSVVPNGSWANLADHASILRTRALQNSAAALSRLSERMLRLGKGTAEMRIAYSLAELYLRLDALEQADGNRFRLPLTQQQLGDFAGLSSVHVCRTMRSLSRKAILTAHGKIDVTIHDLTGLAEIAGADLDTLRRDIIPVP